MSKIVAAHPSVKLVVLRVYYPHGVIVDWRTLTDGLQGLGLTDSDGAWTKDLQGVIMRPQPATA